MKKMEIDKKLEMTEIVYYSIEYQLYLYLFATVQRESSYKCYHGTCYCFTDGTHDFHEIAFVINMLDL